MKSGLRYFFIFICFILSLTDCQELNSKIVINEIMSSNSKVLQDEDGDFPDWIELYNTGDYSISLENWVLTDDEEEMKWRFPEIIIHPDKYLIILCSDKDKFDGSNIHTNFKLRSEGEKIQLLDSNRNLIDEINPVELTTDISYGRIPDGSANLSLFFNPTPGQSNNNTTQLNLIEFSHKPGFYRSEFDLSIIKAFTSDDIYYTLDGSEPSDSSYLYNNPISIKNKNGSPNVYSMIRTNPENAPEGYRWSPPKGDVYKATIVRAASFKKGKRTSKVITATYFVDEQIYNRYTFPIFSLVTDSINFFGFNEGIYVPGKINAESPETSWYWGTGNYHERGDEWERKVHIEMFETDGKLALAQDAGVRIHGNGGRALPEKSLRLYARSEYGKNTFQYKLFPQNNKSEFKRFILRNSGQDFLSTLFSDALIQDLSRHTGIEFQDWRPAIVFINAEYWGIHNVRERYDQYYLKDYCLAPPENIELFGNELLINPSLSKHFNEMYQFMLTHDLSNDDNFDVVAEYLDIYNFINYYVKKVFFAVYDWPGNNVSLWRPKIAGGKWRWLSSDNDDGLIYIDLNSIKHVIADSSQDWRNLPWSTFLFRNLIKNKNFRNKFFATLELRMTTVFRTERILQRVEEFKKIYSEEIDEHIARWNYPKNRETWLNNIDVMKKFAIDRADIVRQHIADYIEATDVWDYTDVNEIITFNISPNPNNGIFKLELIGNLSYNFDFEISDILGRKVYNDKINNYSYYFNAVLNLTELPEGIYLITIRDDKRIFIKKLIIQK